MSETLKFCKDCDYYNANLSGAGFHTCDKAEKVHLNIVTGNSYKTYLECHELRDGECGKEAKYFKPKRTIWMKLKGLLDD